MLRKCYNLKNDLHERKKSNMHKKILTFIILAAMLIGNTTVYAGEFKGDMATGTDAQDEYTIVKATNEDINAQEVFLKQQSSGRCTLTANVNMLRRNAIIHGDAAWRDITENTAAQYLWIDGIGMKWDYKYGDTEVKRVSTANMTGEEKVELFKNLLDIHPEGIVIHDYESKLGYPHAILLTDYTDGEFYCAEPANGYQEGRIPVSKSAVAVEGTDQYWYVTEPGQLETTETTSEAEGTNAMYRLYNPNSGEHFYTAGREERNNVVAAGWKYEGIAWYAPTSGTPVYRLYNPNAGDHHYTMSEEERDNLVSVGWSYEGIAWYSDGSKPMYRVYNPNAVSGAHHYTGSKDEIDNLVSLGWKYEGIAWYAMP